MWAWFRLPCQERKRKSNEARIKSFPRGTSRRPTSQTGGGGGLWGVGRGIIILVPIVLV